MVDPDLVFVDQLERNRCSPRHEQPILFGGLTCGDADVGISVSCCRSIVVPATTSFPMGCTTTEDRSCNQSGDGETPEHIVALSSFALDTFEVTVGRFRNFVNAFDGTESPSGSGSGPERGWKWLESRVEPRAQLGRHVAVGADWQPGVVRHYA